MSLVTFQLSDLNRIKNTGERTKRQKAWNDRFTKWNADVSRGIRFEQPTLKQIIALDGLSDEGGAKLLVEWADKLGAILEEQGLTTTQLRNFFGEVRQIERAGFEKAKRRFILLMPKIEYAAVRDGKPGFRNLKTVLVEAMKLVENDKARFERFAEFFEAILAYHKAYGGS